MHNHFTEDKPHLFFVHSWAVGDAVAIANVYKQALSATGDYGKHGK